MQDNQSIKSSQPPSVKTYADLEVAYSAHLKSKNKSDQNIKNFRSNLNIWRKSFNAELDTAIDLHFGKKFPSNLEKFKANQLKNKAKESTVASKVSNLKRVNEFLTAKSTLENLSPKFGERVQELIRNASFSGIQEFWRFCLKEKCSRNTFVSWCSGASYPTEKSVWVIIEMEKLLKVPAGTLLSLLRSTLNKKKVVHKDNEDRAIKRLINSYSYRVWDKNLEEEFQGLLEFKTESVLPEGMDRHINGNWTTAEGRGVASADYTREKIQSFLGYLHLPKEASAK